MSFAAAEKVADALLYEGYVLYPYRASSAKNRLRFQWGVVAPRDVVAAGEAERWEMQTECLIEAGAPAVLDVKVRFLQLQERALEEAGDAGALRPVEFLDLGGELLVAWDEGMEREIELPGLALAELLAEGERSLDLELPAGEEIEGLRTPAGVVAGRLIRRRRAIAAVVLLAAERAEDGSGLVRLSVRIENRTPWPQGLGASRQEGLWRSLVSTHTLLAVRGGRFVSLLDPPAEAARAAAACVNLHTWPVLAGSGGEDDVVLSSPILLYDHPAVAPESPGDLCDATEIDEILTLRIMTLTEEEKREARGTDPRARQIVERADALPDAVLERLHGAVRSLRPVAAELASWEEFLNPPGEAPPEAATVTVGGVRLGKGARVRLKPSRRADAMDLFLAGREARVEAVYRNVEDEPHVAVTLADDPTGDLQTGRFYYFAPDELEPLPSAGAAPGGAQELACGSDICAPSSLAPPTRAPASTVDPAGGLLVAGIGNVFLGDDGFGVEVARRLAALPLPAGVRVADFGIRGLHLAFEMLEHPEIPTVLVDLTPRGGEPGTVYLIEPDLETLGAGESSGAPDAHAMNPGAVFTLLRSLGGTPPRVLLVGCEPLATEEEMGLSAPVERAVDEAVQLILEVVEGFPQTLEPRR